MTAITRDGAVRILSRAAEGSREKGYLTGASEDLAMMVFAGFEVAGSSDRWSPPTAAELFQRLDDFEFNRAELRQQAANYVDDLQWMQAQQIDWLLANLLITAEVVSTAKLWDRRWFSGGRLRWDRVMIGGIAFLFNWGIWLGVVLATLSILGEAAAWTWVALTAAYKVNAWRIRRKNANLLASMAAVYEASRSATLSWAVIWDMLAKTRDRGAVWDPELYRLVEVCMARRLNK